MAKIIQARVDERLLHGQASIWMQVNNSNSVIVANDYSATNQSQQDLMKTTVPEGVKCSFYSIKKLIEVWPKAGEWQIFYIIVDSIADMYQLVVGGLPISEINLGNIHTRNDRQRITPSVNLSNEERKLIKELYEKYNVKFNTQSLPGVTKGLVSIDKLI